MTRISDLRVDDIFTKIDANNNAKTIGKMVCGKINWCTFRKWIK